jgi:hypothetical protein
MPIVKLYYGMTSEEYMHIILTGDASALITTDVLGKGVYTVDSLECAHQIGRNKGDGKGSIVYEYEIDTAYCKFTQRAASAGVPACTTYLMEHWYLAKNTRTDVSHPTFRGSPQELATFFAKSGIK